MSDAAFEKLLNQVYSWWPSTIGSPRDVADITVGIEGMEQFYESQIAPLAHASGSRLLEQLDWIVYGAVCSILRTSRIVRMQEIRSEYLKNRFHNLLLTVGLKQLKGEIEVDGSFDLSELTEYFKSADLEGAD